LFGLLAVVSTAFPQGRMDPTERAKMLKERLTLTDEQTIKVTDILTASQAEMQKLRDASGGDREAMRAGMQDLRRKTDAKITALLTEKQKKEFEKLRKEQEEQMRQWREQQGR
jgi:Spy/CpxP family protein refolding chaperone